MMNPSQLSLLEKRLDYVRELASERLAELPNTFSPETRAAVATYLNAVLAISDVPNDESERYKMGRETLFDPEIGVKLYRRMNAARIGHRIARVAFSMARRSTEEAHFSDVA